ncbi:LutC/YkgG family protein [Alicyclobacillus dauci]|uniref:Lactate utilization protein n=1 Tax=Alicyclobacillus dauci TaxID=1475485 RepID=A0ABY6Z575_9BACL|nr:lactate utilization protein [Alicyclobacillus dauci]WAH38037.1 lactate utilization protein [Alicyclobacillus dauci]
MNKADFLANISSRLGRQTNDPPSPRQVAGVPEFWADRVLDAPELTARFVESFAGLGGEIECFDSESALVDRIDSFLTELAPTRVGAWGQRANWSVNVERVLEKWDALRWDQTTPQEFANVQVSVTGCTYAIADTGTIVMTSSESQGRGTHVLPLVHLVVMTGDQIRLRLGEVFHLLTENAASAGGSLPAYTHFVSGPSRSSDIENDQSIGVHGPARVVVFLLTRDAG